MALLWLLAAFVALTLAIVAGLFVVLRRRFVTGRGAPPRGLAAGRMAPPAEGEEK